MSSITVAFDERRGRGQAIPVPVEIFNEQLTRVAEEVIGPGRRKRIDVAEPGLYHVRAELPTGESVSTTVNVEGADSDALAMLTAGEGSPRGISAWAYTPPRSRRVEREVRGWSGDWMRRSSFAFPKWFGMRSGRVLGEAAEIFRIAPGDPHWELSPADVPLEWEASVRGDDPRRIGELRMNYVDEEAALCLRVELRSTGSAPEGRCVMVPGSRGGRVLFFHDEGAGPGTVRTLVSGAAPEAEALMAYLENGAIGAARRVGDAVVRQADESSRGRRTDPFGACIAGYFLLRAGRLERQAWMKNLADWFPDIPDGAVIYAVSLLRDPDATGRRAHAARDYLLEAVRRGVPIYTVGLRLLFDSLQYLAREEDDREVASALARVRFIAAYTDWDAQTTTFSIPALQEGGFRF
jgi:hypothetical protein